MNDANTSNTPSSNTNTPTREDILVAAARFAEAAQVAQQAHFDHRGYTFGRPVVFLDKPGQRYVRIIEATVHTGQTEPAHRRVHAFIDLTNGDVLKAASWKAPAKHARGNVLRQDNGTGALTARGGVHYLR